MSNATNTITTAIHINEVFTDQAGFGFPSPGTGFMSGLTHDDGATIFIDNSTTALCGSAAPTNTVRQPCMLPAGLLPGLHTLDLYYEESFGAPAVLAVTLPSEVPEPASLALLGSALLGFGVFKRRRTG